MNKNHTYLYEHPLLTEFKIAAMKGEWSYLENRLLPRLSEHEITSQFFRWACNNGLKNEKTNFRTLAGYILEKAPVPENVLDKMASYVLEAMDGEDDINTKYRFAFALAAHKAKGCKKQVIPVLEQALKDENVYAVAEKYLRELKEKS